MDPFGCCFSAVGGSVSGPDILSLASTIGLPCYYSVGGDSVYVVGNERRVRRHISYDYLSEVPLGCIGRDGQ